MAKTSNGIVRMLIPFGVVCAALLYIIGLCAAMVAENINMIGIYNGYIEDSDLFMGQSFRQTVSLLSGYTVFYIILIALAVVAFVLLSLYFARVAVPPIKAARRAQKTGNIELFPVEKVSALLIAGYCIVFIVLLVAIHMTVSQFENVYRGLMTTIETTDISLLPESQVNTYYANIRGYITYLVVYIIGAALCTAAAVCCAVRFVRVYAEDKRR